MGVGILPFRGASVVLDGPEDVMRSKSCHCPHWPMRDGKPDRACVRERRLHCFYINQLTKGERDEGGGLSNVRMQSTNPIQKGMMSHVPQPMGAGELESVGVLNRRWILTGAGRSLHYQRGVFSQNQREGDERVCV